MNRPKDYNICFTINYVSKNINYVPLQILFEGEKVSV